MLLSEYVERLKQVNETKRRLEEEERRLSAPTIGDVSRIPDIFELGVQGFLSRHPKAKRKDSYRAVLFVTLFLFSPKSLSGGNAKPGVRGRLAEKMGFSPTNISHLTKDLLFHYNVYREFREDVNDIFTFVMDKLKNK